MSQWSAVSHRWIICIALVFVCTTFGHAKATNFCNETVLEECEAFIELRGDMIPSPKITYDTEEKLNRVCSSLNALEECVTNSSCGGYSDGRIDRYLYTFDYVCVQTKKIYLDNNGCFTSDVTRHNLTVCNDAAESQHDATECKKHETLMTCMRQMYTGNCGKQAADVIMHVQENINKNPCDPFRHVRSDVTRAAPSWLVFVVWFGLVLTFNTRQSMN